MTDDDKDGGADGDDDARKDGGGDWEKAHKTIANPLCGGFSAHSLQSTMHSAPALQLVEKSRAQPALGNDEIAHPKLHVLRNCALATGPF